MGTRGMAAYNGNIGGKIEFDQHQKFTIANPQIQNHRFDILLDNPSTLDITVNG